MSKLQNHLSVYFLRERNFSWSPCWSYWRSYGWCGTSNDFFTLIKLERIKKTCLFRQLFCLWLQTTCQSVFFCLKGFACRWKLVFFLVLSFFFRDTNNNKWLKCNKTEFFFFNSLNVFDSFFFNRSGWTNMIWKPWPNCQKR